MCILINTITMYKQCLDIEGIRLDFMNKEERKEFVKNELIAIYEEIDNSIKQLVLSRKFLKILVNVSKGAEPNYNHSIKNLATKKI